MSKVGLSFAVYGVKLHVLCATNRVPVSYELTPANAAEARLVRELLAEAEILFGDGAARKLLGDLAYRGEELREALDECGVLLATERADRRRPALRQQVEVCFAALKRVLGLGARGDTGEDALGAGDQDRGQEITAYTYAFLVNRLLGRSQGRKGPVGLETAHQTSRSTRKRSVVEHSDSIRSKGRRVLRDGLVEDLVAEHGQGRVHEPYKLCMLGAEVWAGALRRLLILWRCSALGLMKQKGPGSVSPGPCA